MSRAIARAGALSAFFVSLSLILGMGVAQAEPSPENRAAAEGLFQEGGELFKQGRYAEACTKLEASQSLDPASGTLLNLARCYEKVGKTASAWLAFTDVAGAAKKAGQLSREEVARESAARLAPLLAKIIIQVPAGVVVDGLEVRRDGAVVPRQLWNLSAPIDPGDHLVECTAPGKKPWSNRIRLDARQQATLAVPPLEDLPRVAGAGTIVGQGHGTNRKKVAALVSMGVGVVAVGVGAAYGFKALGDRRTADRTCSGGICSDQIGFDANRAALSEARLSTVFVGVGVAALAAGGLLYYWQTRPADRQTEPARVARLQWSIVPRMDGAGGDIAVGGVW